MHKFVNLTIVWEYGCVGVWEKKTLPHTHTPILPYSHTEWKPEPNVELHKLMHASVGANLSVSRKSVCLSVSEVRVYGEGVTAKYGMQPSVSISG